MLSDVTRVRGIRRLNRAGHPRWLFHLQIRLVTWGLLLQHKHSRDQGRYCKAYSDPVSAFSLICFRNQIPNPDSRGGSLIGHEYWKMWDIFKDKLLSKKKKIHFYAQENFPFIVWLSRKINHYFDLWCKVWAQMVERTSVLLIVAFTSPRVTVLQLPHHEGLLFSQSFCYLWSRTQHILNQGLDTT